MFCIVSSPAPTHPSVSFPTGPQGRGSPGMWPSSPTYPPQMNSAICLLLQCTNRILRVLFSFVLFWFEFLKFVVKEKREQKTFFGCSYQLIFGCFRVPRPAGIQEFIGWCQQESTDPNKGARTWTAVLARDQQEAREPMLLSHHRSSCYKPFLGTRLLLRFLGADWLLLL